jgi:CxxC motif-containing protein (DUF1111 family)
MRSCRISCVLIGASLAVLHQSSDARDKVTTAEPKAVAQAIDGSELFSREWLPNDPRSHGGDGLGPMFNDSSCVACHNQGGVGGAGPASKNVDIVTAFNNLLILRQMQQLGQQAVPSPSLPQPVIVPPTLPQQVFRSIFGNVDVPSQTSQAVPSQPRSRQPAVQSQPLPVPLGILNDPFAPTTTATQPRSEPLGTSQSPTNLLDAQPRRPVAEPPNAERALAAAQERAEQLRQQQARDRKQLNALHPGFAFSPSVVLHKAATVVGYETWRGRLSGMGSGRRGLVGLASGGPVFVNAVNTSILVPAQRGQARTQAMAEIQQMRNRMQLSRARRINPNSTFQRGSFAITRSQRNTTALFGAGLIDAIPVSLLEELEQQQDDRNRSDPKVTGRVARLKDGSAGRFGWKAQTASLREFVMTACAVEVGLNVPDHPQAGVPQKPDYEVAGLDLNQAQCNALIQYISDLPAPTRQVPLDKEAAEWIADGHRLFASVGCAKCHAENVGEVAGIFSDLLLHDLGPLLGDTGSYGVFLPDTSPEQVPLEDLVNVRQPGSQTQPQKIIGATRLEWRTPPLWGVRDSAPYLHDGRAETLEQAIAMHGGESEHITQAFFALTPQKRFKLISFLKTLTAPQQQVAQLAR